MAVTIAQPTRIQRADWRRRLAAGAAAAAVVAVLAACAAQITPSPGSSSTPNPSPAPSATFTATPEPTATPNAGLTLPAPSATSQVPISYSLTVDVQAGQSGRLVVVVTNLSRTMVSELVLRWPTAVRSTLFLAPFQPSLQRIREGGPPLVQDWTKWVDGPGESGEPAGTTSLGWGPLLPSGTLTIPILATRVAHGPLTFDFQILAGEAMLLSKGSPAWFKVTAP